MFTSTYAIQKYTVVQAPALLPKVISWHPLSYLFAGFGMSNIFTTSAWQYIVSVCQTFQNLLVLYSLLLVFIFTLIILIVSAIWTYKNSQEEIYFKNKYRYTTAIKYTGEDSATHYFIRAMAFVNAVMCTLVCLTMIFGPVSFWIPFMGDLAYNSMTASTFFTFILFVSIGGISWMLWNGNSYANRGYFVRFISTGHTILVTALVTSIIFMKVGLGPVYSLSHLPKNGLDAFPQYAGDSAKFAGSNVPWFASTSTTAMHSNTVSDSGLSLSNVCGGVQAKYVATGTYLGSNTIHPIPVQVSPGYNWYAMWPKWILHSKLYQGGLILGVLASLKLDYFVIFVLIYCVSWFLLYAIVRAIGRAISYLGEYVGKMCIGGDRSTVHSSMMGAIVCFMLLTIAIILIANTATIAVLGKLSSSTSTGFIGTLKELLTLDRYMGTL